MIALPVTKLRSNVHFQGVACVLPIKQGRIGMPKVP